VRLRDGRARLLLEELLDGDTCEDGALGGEAASTSACVDEEDFDGLDGPFNLGREHGNLVTLLEHVVGSDGVVVDADDPAGEVSVPSGHDEVSEGGACWDSLVAGEASAVGVQEYE
jgi:hypothetical protein